MTSDVTVTAQRTARSEAGWRWRGDGGGTVAVSAGYELALVGMYGTSIKSRGHERYEK